MFFTVSARLLRCHGSIAHLGGADYLNCSVYRDCSDCRVDPGDLASGSAGELSRQKRSAPGPMPPLSVNATAGHPGHPARPGDSGLSPRAVWARLPFRRRVRACILCVMEVHGLSIPPNDDGKKTVAEVAATNAEHGVTSVHSCVNPELTQTFCVHDAPTPESIRKVACRHGPPVGCITAQRSTGSRGATDA